MRALTFFSIFIFLTMQCAALQVGELSYVETFKPGESKQVKVVLTNETDHSEIINYTLSDYQCNPEGQHFFEAPGTFPRSNASWITLNSVREDIPANSKSDLYFTINAPTDPQLKGSYWSILLIEPADPVQTLKNSNDGLQLFVKIRFAYHIVTTIGEGTPKLKTVEKGIKVVDEKEMLYIDVMNTGDLFLNPTLALQLYDEEGQLVKTLNGQAERLYPGNAQRYHLDAEGLEGKKLTGLLVLDNGDGQLFGDSIQLNFP